MCIGSVIRAWAKALSSQLPKCAVAKRMPRPAFLRFEIMFQSFVTYPLGNVLAIHVRETREDPDQTGDGAENFVGDGAALAARFLRIGEFEIAHRGAAQAGDGEVEEAGVEAGQAEWRVGQPTSRRNPDYSIHPPPSTRSPS